MVYDRSAFWIARLAKSKRHMSDNNAGQHKSTEKASLS